MSRTRHQIGTVIALKPVEYSCTRGPGILDKIGRGHQGARAHMWWAVAAVVLLWYTVTGNTNCDCIGSDCAALADLYTKTGADCTRTGLFL